MASDVSISFGGELDELKSSLQGMESYIKGWGDTIKGLGIGAFAGWAVGKVKDEIFGMGQEAMEAAEKQAQLEAVVAATGQAAGFSADQLADMAADLRDITQVDDDLIKGAQTVIATFKEIKGDTFERTTQAALDMSAALGTDLTGAAGQLGKALNDPERGMMMLSKSGVIFSDAQKEAVKAMIEAGDVAGAQAVILEKLEGQYGGAAEKVAESQGPWAEWANIIGDVREAIGTGLLAVLEPLMPLIDEGMTLVKGWADSFAELGPTITDIAGGAITFLVGEFNMFLDIGTSVLTGIGELWQWAFGESASDSMGSIFAYAKDVFTGMVELAVGFWSAVQVGFENIPTVASIAWDSMKLGAVSLFEDLKHFFLDTAPELVSWFADNWYEIFQDMYNFTATVFDNMFDNVVTFFQGVYDWLSGGEASFEFKALTEGFESSLKELPNIVEREMTDTEKALSAKIGEQGAALAGEYQKKFKDNMKMLGFGDDVETPQAAASVASAPPTPQAAASVASESELAGRKSDKEEKSSAGKFEDLQGLFKRIQSSAASESPEAKATEKVVAETKDVKENTKKAADLLGNVKDGINSLVSSITSGFTAVLGE